MKTKNITTPPTRKSIGRSALRCCFFLISLVLGCFALSPASLAQLPGPTPDGGYPGNNTAEGTGALQSLTIGFDDTATGYQALYSNTTGFYNTATGYQALLSDTEGFSNTATGINALEFNTAGNGNTAT